MLAHEPLRRDQRATREDRPVTHRVRELDRLRRAIEPTECVPGTAPTRVDDTSIGR